MSKRDNGGSGEDRLIDRFFRKIATHEGAFRLLDDAAVVTPPAGSDVVLKTDAIVGGVHFFPDDPADTVAKKALRVNLSDLAAKGAEPLGFLLALSLPAQTGEQWLADFSRGLAADAEAYRCPLFGGDTDRTPGPITISISAFGHLPHGTIVRRAGAKPGDLVVVSGTIGDAALGLRLKTEPDRAAFAGLNEKGKAHLAARYLLPQPRLALADAIRRLASASIDVSDGLVGDITKLAATSAVAASVEARKVPLSEAGQIVVAAEPALLDTVLTGGDDYEVVLAIAEDRFGALQTAAASAGVQVTAIGRIEAGEGVRVLGSDGSPMTFRKTSFSHF